ncbi:MAG: rubrerythrin [Betaproteobacteria bacterium RIFCSPLOWO2_02_FULL_66_14]|nr:MAG: rubrerythrin [Betaproteobacteria bacterium RIFCSPLOWO2_02_FULL_66_14]
MSYTLPEFLAHAIAMEQEAVDRYLELADMMEAHRNDAVSKVFRDMSHFSELHRDSIRERVGATELPKLKSWQYRWRTPPEVGGEEAFDYLLEAFNALKYARGNEMRSLKYYRSVAGESQDSEVKRLASEFAAEEREHVLALDEWLARTPRPSTTFADDPESMEPV